MLTLRQPLGVHVFLILVLAALAFLLDFLPGTWP